MLTGKALEAHYYLDQPGFVTDISKRSNNYRNIVNRISKRLRDRGLVGTDDSRYYVTGDFDRLHEFACELMDHFHRQRLKSVVPDGKILWENYDEFLAKTETEIDAEHFHETVLARFAAFKLLEFVHPRTTASRSSA